MNIRRDPAFPTLDTADPALRPGLTKREYAAILLRVPDSGDPEIDKMIRAARRQEFASAALEGLLCHGAVRAETGTPATAGWYAEKAVACADATILVLEDQ